MKRMDGFYFVFNSEGEQVLIQGKENAKRVFEDFKESARKGYTEFLDYPEVREAMIEANGRVTFSGHTYYFS